MILLTAWRYHWRLGRPFEFTTLEGWELVDERVKVRTFFLDTRRFPTFFADVRQRLVRDSSRTVSVSDDWSISKLATEQVLMGAWSLWRRPVDPIPMAEVIVDETPVPMEVPPVEHPPEIRPPEPDPPTLEANADEKAIADAMRRASSTGVWFCEECMRAQLAALRNEKEKPEKQRAEIRVQPLAIEFGALPAKRGEASDIVTIMSIGTAPLNVTSIQLSGKDFELAPDSILSASLAPGESMSVEVLAHPQAEGSISGKVQVSSNAVNVAGAVPVIVCCEGIRPLIEVRELAS